MTQSQRTVQARARSVADLAQQIHQLSPIVAELQALGIQDRWEQERDALALAYLRAQVAQRWPDRTVQS
jgi:hypothetical protein